MAENQDGSWQTRLIDKVPARLLSGAAILVGLAAIIFMAVLLHAYSNDRLVSLFGVKFSESARGPSQFPKGVVLAFEGECPKEPGWGRYEKAAARFIIGAASKDELDAGPAQFRNGSNGEPLTARPPGKPDGTENVKLELKHLPDHNHPVSARQNVEVHDGLAGGNDTIKHGIDQDYREGAPAGDWGTLDKLIGHEGGGEAHYNMPPYVALYFCQYKGTS